MKNTKNQIIIIEKNKSKQKSNRKHCSQLHETVMFIVPTHDNIFMLKSKLVTFQFHCSTVKRKCFNNFRFELNNWNLIKNNYFQFCKTFCRRDDHIKNVVRFRMSNLNSVFQIQMEIIKSVTINFEDNLNFKKRPGVPSRFNLGSWAVLLNELLIRKICFSSSDT